MNVSRFLKYGLSAVCLATILTSAAHATTYSSSYGTGNKSYSHTVSVASHQAKVDSIPQWSQYYIQWRVNGTWVKESDLGWGLYYGVLDFEWEGNRFKFTGVHDGTVYVYASSVTIQAYVQNSSGTTLETHTWNITGGKPDLQVASITDTASSYNTGDKIQARAWIKNFGTSPAGSSSVKYYLGTLNNKTYRFIENGSIGSLDPGQQKDDIINWPYWTIPDDIPSGTYYIWVQADSGNDVDESNEGNNWGKSASFTIHQKQADLRVASVVDTASSYNTGDKIQARAWIRNYGDKAAGSSSIKYYLGTLNNETYRFIENGSIGSLDPGQQKDDIINWPYWTIPDDIPSGTYYIWVQADAGNDVDESNEGNNWGKSASFTIQRIQPDLIGAGAFTSQDYYPGDTVEFSFAVKNDGDGAANAGVAHYFARNGSASYAAADRFTSTSYGALPANSDLVAQNFNWNIPTDAEPGTYAVSYWIDATDTTSNESNEDNNKGVWYVTVSSRPDVFLSTSVLPDLTDKNYLPHLDPEDRCDDWDGDGTVDSGWTMNSSRCFAPGDTILIHATVDSDSAVQRQVRMTAYRNTTAAEAGWSQIGSTTNDVAAGDSRRFVIPWTAPADGMYFVYVKVEMFDGAEWLETDGAWIGDGTFYDYALISSDVPVILIHGWSGSRDSFGNLELLTELTLQRPVRIFEYQTAKFAPDHGPRVTEGWEGKPSLPAQLQAFLSAPEGGAGAGIVAADVVAHSMGGLVARKYALQEDKLRRLVTLGTPNYGGNYAETFGGILNNQAEDLEYGCALGWQLFHGWKMSAAAMPQVLAVCGTDEFFSFSRYNDSDGTVRCESASIENLGFPAYYVPLRHTELPGVDDQTHESWAPIMHALNGASYPYASAPGNNGNADDVGVWTHSKALKVGMVQAVLRYGDEVLYLNQDQVDIYLTTGGALNYNINSSDWDGNGSLESVVYKTKADCDDEITGSESYSRYVAYIDVPGRDTLVQVMDANAGETTIFDFDIGGAPDTPTPIAPEDNAVLTSLTPTLQWSAFSSGTPGRTQAGYEVRVRCDTDGDVIVYSNYVASASGTTHTIPAGRLEYNKQYHWHVRYKDNEGVWSAWSADDPNPHQDFYTVETGTFVIYSSHGSPNPAPGSYDWASGQTMPAGSVSSPADQSGGTRWRCTGHTGTGSAPNGPGTSYSSFTITEDSTLRWNWRAQYQVTQEAIGAGSINPSSASWLDRGSDVAFTADADSGYAVDKWLVNGTTVQNGGTEYTLNNVREPSSVQVTFRSTEPDNVAPVLAEGASVNVTMSQDGDPTPFDLTLHASDANGDSIYWSIDAHPSHGHASVSGTGTTKPISYTPAAGYTGTDSFVVQVNDGRGGTDSIKVNVAIGSVETVATPTFNPDGGSHSGSSVSVTVSCATAGATIRYTVGSGTTAGDDPTEASSSVAAGGSVNVPVPGWLKAKAWKTGMTASEIKSAHYSSDTGGENVALAANGGVATADSVGSYLGVTHPASNANDGDTGTDWCNSWTMPSWLRIEFDASYLVGKVAVVWGHGAHNQIFSISLSENGTDWTVVVPSRESNTDAGDDGGGYHGNTSVVREEFPITPHNARFMRINITSSSAPGSHIFKAIVHELEAYTDAGGIGDTESPTVQITTPTTTASMYTSRTNRLDIGGTAADNVGVTSVNLRNARDLIDYMCTGTASWQYTGLPLYEGRNDITVTAHDAAGNTATDRITVFYVPDGNCANDFDGDGRSDLGVYYPPLGKWYMFASTTGFYENQFGYTGTVPITGDFDGDGVSDVGVYYAPLGKWYIFASTTGFYENQFGYAGTIPITGDFDGDGRDDIGCYHPASGSWYVFQSTEGFRQTQFGSSGTIPVTGDFDGDGSCDFGYYHAASGAWKLALSTGGFLETQFGFAGTTPIVGDFDGDGIDDFGVYYAPLGKWYIFASTTGFYENQFGYDGTVPVVGDFDGDGRADIGCYYPPLGKWYIFQSTEGFYETQFGYENTMPLGSTQTAP